jgi:hypothetical protein
MAKLQLGGHITIVGSAKLPQEVRDEVLQAGEGKHKEIRAVMKDGKGNDVVFKGKLALSDKGSLTARFALKLEDFDIALVDDAVAQTPKTDEEKQAEKDAKIKANAASLAAELLG